MMLSKRLNKLFWITSTSGLLSVAISVGAFGVNPPTASLVQASYKNWGIINSEAHSHVSALDAWKIEEGSRDIVVAVIDTGIDPTHRDLSQNIWHDPKAPTNVAAYGWNFVSNEANPTDEHGHGTHVAA